ncbi:MAG TPA: peptidoglycan DD-metalloendopeptidase family protein [Candidatus Gemmiger faecavium]|nr:peptidoglycan DD-metalloendopeptidase family protein [Candidatus Gemmiger faecavium]
MHIRHWNWKRLISAMLCTAAATALVLSAATPVSADAKLDELLKQKQEYQKQLEEINQQIADNESTLADAEEQKQLLEQQQSVITSQIDLITTQKNEVNEQISAKQEEIEQKQADLDQKQADIDQRWEDFKLRMKAMQQLNDGGSIALLSAATNLYELLSFQQTLTDIYEKDEEVLAELDAEYDELNAQKQDLENDKAELEANLATLSDLGDQLDSKNQELKNSIQQQDATISESEALAQSLTEEQKKIQAAATEAENAYDSYLQSQIKQYGTNVQIHCSLDFINPLNSYKYISCYFGDGGHGGTDFAAPGGTEIHAMADGVVTNATYHYSYGYYVMIYHGKADDGNTYATLYAHMNSQPKVSVGQTVSKGELIGYVGTTGNSTGNHLHLEMRVNGVRVSVLPYISY